MKELACIVTGPERNGTTFFKKILDSHPDIYSGFETGILMQEDFKLCEPFCEWIYNPGAHWGLSKDISFGNKTFSEKYELLFKHKGSYHKKCGIQNLIKQSRHLIDKTPAYMKKLKYVRENSDKDVPIFIIIKNFKNNYISRVINHNEGEESFLTTMQEVKHSLDYLIETKDSENIHLFQYEDAASNQHKFIQKIKSLLKNRININYDMSLNLHEQKTKHLKQARVKIPYSNWRPKPTELSKEELPKYSKIVSKLNSLQKSFESNYNEIIQHYKQNLN